LSVSSAPYHGPHARHSIVVTLRTYVLCSVGYLHVIYVPLRYLSVVCSTVLYVNRHITDGTYSCWYPVSSSMRRWQLPLGDRFSHPSHDFIVNNDAELLFYYS